MKRALIIIIVATLVLPLAAQSVTKAAARDETTIYRDEYGIPHVFAIPYADEVGLADQVYEMMMARNLEEMKRALAHLQLMAQNIMVGLFRETSTTFATGACRFARRVLIRAVPLPGTLLPLNGKVFTRSAIWFKSRIRRWVTCTTAT